jgi:hypothetical protein
VAEEVRRAAGLLEGAGGHGVSYKVTFTCHACDKELRVQHDGGEETIEVVREFLQEHIIKHVRDIQDIDALVKVLRKVEES